MLPVDTSPSTRDPSEAPAPSGVSSMPPKDVTDDYGASAPAASVTAASAPEDSEVVPTVARSTEILSGPGQVVSLGTPGAAAALRVSPIPSASSGQDARDNMASTALSRTTTPLPAALMEEDGRSQRGSTAGGSDNNDSTAYYTAHGAGMPRNFRISFDGYTLLRDEDGTFAAYRITVTAGLHQWQVLRRYTRTRREYLHGVFRVHLVSS